MALDCGSIKEANGGAWATSSQGFLLSPSDLPPDRSWSPLRRSWTHMVPQFPAANARNACFRVDFHFPVIFPCERVKVTRKRKSWTWLNFHVHAWPTSSPGRFSPPKPGKSALRTRLTRGLSYIASISFTRVHTGKQRDSGNHPLGEKLFPLLTHKWDSAEQ